MKKRSYRIQDMPVDSRPRERLLKYGADILSDVELVAILLGTGSKGLNVLELASRLLVLAKGPAGIFEMDVHMLRLEPGVGLATAARFVAAAELARRSRNGFVNKKISSLNHIVDIASPYLCEEDSSCPLLFVMDRFFLLKDIVKLNVGMFKKHSNIIANIMQNVFMRNGLSIALVHRHIADSGDVCVLCMREEGESFTKLLCAAAKVCGVSFSGNILLFGSSWKEVV